MGNKVSYNTADEKPLVSQGTGQSFIFVSTTEKTFDDGFRNPGNRSRWNRHVISAYLRINQEKKSSALVGLLDPPSHHLIHLSGESNAVHRSGPAKSRPWWSNVQGMWWLQTEICGVLVGSTLCRTRGSNTCSANQSTAGAKPEGTTRRSELPSTDRYKRVCCEVSNKNMSGYCHPDVAMRGKTVRFVVMPNSTVSKCGFSVKPYQQHPNSLPVTI